jgi:hypothetical protein
MRARRGAGAGTDHEKEIKGENTNFADEPMYTKTPQYMGRMALAQ